MGTMKLPFVPQATVCRVHMSISGTVYTIFWTSGVSCGFQSQSGQPYFHLGGGIQDIHYLRFISGATPLPVYMASIAASRLPLHVCFNRGKRLKWVISPLAIIRANPRDYRLTHISVFHLGTPPVLDSIPSPIQMGIP